MILLHILQWCNIKYEICPKLGALPRYVKFSMNNSVTNWKYLFCRYQGKGPTHIGRNYAFQKSLDLWEARPKFNFNGPLRSTSKFQIHRTSGKYVQNSNPWTSGKHIQNSIPSDLQEARPKFKSNPWTFEKHVQNSISMDLQEARPNFKSIGTLGSTFKFKSIRPLGSMSKLQTIKPLGSTSKIQIHWTSRKHV